MLIAGIVFNLWLYRLEPTAPIDPNDNTFQFALVDRTNQILDFAQQTCSGITKPFCVTFYLADHWVPNWAEGYNLPYYYSHIPQIAVVASWRLFHLFVPTVTLFSYYHIVIYLLLSFFPLSVFLALRVIGLPWLSAGVGAVFATHLSTDGLYGIDPPSFLWRGYGLSSQLFAMIWFPLAIAYTWKYLYEEKGDGRQFLRELAFRLHVGTGDTRKERHLAREEASHDPENSVRASRKNSSTNSLVLGVVFLSATTAGHLGIGMMAFLTVAMLAFAPLPHSLLLSQWGEGLGKGLKNNMLKLTLLLGGAGVLLAYWIVPILLNGDYHNISFWDPVWKFDSYGAKDTIIRLLNGELFDFGRLPVLTYIVLVASIVTLGTSYYPFSILFFLWIFLYFGRTTWGGLIDLIPGMREFHLSRFIVAVQMIGLFLIPLGVDWIVTKASSLPVFRMPRQFAAFVVLIVLVSLVYPQTVRYASFNDTLIARARGNYSEAQEDTSLLLETLRDLEKTSPGRVFAGRGGSWGRDFRIAETPYYMHLSTYGIPVVLWLPETWSPNSDVEQYFSEDQEKDYVLYNIRYVVTPPDREPQPFWKLLKSSPHWKLYEVQTDGYITTGISPAIVSTTKETFINVVRLWIQSDYHKRSLYPQLVFDPTFPKKVGLPNFRMTDEATYRVPAGTTHSLFADIPVYLTPDGCENGGAKILSQSSSSDMNFTARAEVTSNCTRSVVILRQSYHPSWRATINGTPARTITVFPFYIAVVLEKPGTYDITFSYKPSLLKVSLALLVMAGLVSFFAIRKRGPRQERSR